MSLGRSVSNYIGNAVANVAIVRWEREIDRSTLR
jgi:hypothetical protein